ncbi:MAG: hypothetical protein ACPGXX_20215 [Planctomycetaceae bacterium]
MTCRPAGLLVADPFRACRFPCSDIERHSVEEFRTRFVEFLILLFLYRQQQRIAFPRPKLPEYTVISSERGGFPIVLRVYGSLCCSTA